jgi:hypothetical protein
MHAGAGLDVALSGAERRWSMIRKSGNRFSEKIMLKQNAGDQF